MQNTELVARVTSHGNHLLIYSDLLQEQLSRLYASGARRCTVRLRPLAGDAVIIDATIVRKRERLFLRPLQEGQAVLQHFYKLYKGGYEGRRPMPVVIEEIIPSGAKSL